MLKYAQKAFLAIPSPKQLIAELTEGSPKKPSTSTRGSSLTLVSLNRTRRLSTGALLRKSSMALVSVALVLDSSTNTPCVFVGPTNWVCLTRMCSTLATRLKRSWTALLRPPISSPTCGRSISTPVGTGKTVNTLIKEAL